MRSWSPGSFLRHTSIRVKVLIPPGILILALAIVSALSVYGLNEQRAALSEVNDIALEKITLVDEFIALSERVQSDVFRISVLYFMNLPEKDIQPVHARLEQGLSDLYVIYGQIFTKWPLDETEVVILEGMKEPMDDFTGQAREAAAVVSENPSFGILLVRSSTVPFSEFRATLGKFLDYQQDKIIRTEAQADQRATTISRVIITLTLLIALVGLMSTVLISTRLISHPIRSMTDLMGRLAKGELSIEIGDTEGQDEIGSMARAVEVFRNNAIEKAQAEMALRQERDRAQSYLDIAGVIFVALNEKGEISLINRRGCKTLGYEEKELVGQNWFDTFVPARDQERGKASFAQLMLGEVESVEYFENAITTRHGEERIIAWHNSLLTDEAGDIIGTLSSGEDITERKRAEEALQQSHHQLEQTLAELKDTQERMVQQERLAAVGQLSAGIAHDFNNILASITLYTQMSLRSTESSPKIRQRLQVIAKQADRAADLVQQILDFGRRSVIERRPLALVPFLKETVDLLKRTLPESIQINLDLGAAPSAEAPGEYVINADPTRIQQAIVNLALNAREAMPRGGALRIAMSRARVSDGIKCVTCGQIVAGEWVQLMVTDTGVGIPPDVLPHIFEPFFTTRAPMGSGLGLAQVYGIVKQHEGHIDVVTEVGRGTTFTLYCPALRVSAPEIDTPGGPGVAVGSEETVLVVEDDLVMRVALMDVLEMLNYRVLEASNGREALTVVEQHEGEIPLVLSDWVMPLMGGLELVREMRQRHPAVKVLMLTGHPLSELTIESAPEGVVGWVQKPPSLEQLAEAVARALGKESE